MKLSAQWLRDFVDIPADNRRLAEALTAAGIAVENVIGEGDATVFEMEIGTNRPDAMNHYGVAREASAIYDRALKPIALVLPDSKGKAKFGIAIQDPEGCARYTARIVRGISVKASPDPIAKRLMSVDQRPINNGADASNYTLWEMGHPTHAFDLDLLEGAEILVRRAKAGETLKTLDGVDRKLSPEDLIIADARKPVALAGVMGGFDTMITEKTRNILIESAWFDPLAVRRSSRRHGLHTDASHRFERGADYGATSLACARVAQRIIEAGGGHLEGAEIDVVARHLDLAPVALHVSEVSRILGERLEVREILRILSRLGFDAIPERRDESEFTVRIPSWRLDVEREIDLIEEIARLHGYDRVTNTLPAYTGSVAELPDAATDRKLRSALLALGYNEAVSLSFIAAEDAAQFAGEPVIELANPLSEEASVMRPSLVPSMLDMLAYNLNRGNDSVRLFEAANVFVKSGVKAVESKQICIGATGNAVAPGVHQTAREISFFHVKGDIETLLAGFDCTTLSYVGDGAAYYHPGRSARAVMDGVMVAQFGQIHPDMAAARKLRQPVFVAELFLDRLYEHRLREVRYKPLPRFPAVERDFSFAFADEIIFEQIREACGKLGIHELRSFVPVEIFRGGNVPAGKYSILLRATFQSYEQTLREEEVARWSEHIIRQLEALGGKLRA